MEGTSCSKSREQGNLMSLGQGSMRLKLPWLLCFYTDMVLYTGGSFFSLSFICLQLIVGKIILVAVKVIPSQKIIGCIRLFLLCAHFFQL